MTTRKQDHSLFERWIERYARVGYGAKGIVYGTVGLFALLESLDLSNSEAEMGTEGALRQIAAQPFGKAMLVVLTVSLAGYVVWRLIQAALDPEHSGCEASDILRRLSYAASGVAYAGLAYSAVQILRVSASAEGGKTAEEWALSIMNQPFGRWTVGAAGLVICGVGCYYFYRAIKAEFRKRFKLHQMSPATKTWATIAGRVGIAARGIVYVAVGTYGVRAAWQYDPSTIKTTKDILAIFDNNSTDEWILAILGIGFVAYGIHMGFQAAYRSIDPL